MLELFEDIWIELDSATIRPEEVDAVQTTYEGECWIFLKSGTRMTVKQSRESVMKLVKGEENNVRE